MQKHPSDWQEQLLSFKHLRGDKMDFENYFPYFEGYVYSVAVSNGIRGEMIGTSIRGQYRWNIIRLNISIDWIRNLEWSSIIIIIVIIDYNLNLFSNNENKQKAWFLH